jgi:predicted GH43/DUF377 family glycosyl hydrolase
MAYENNPILDPGEPREWDELAVVIPSALRYENVFYLFYSGLRKNGQVCIGLAVSDDGYHFEKYDNNPLLFPREKGFDSYQVAAPVLIRENSIRIMYYNSAETAIYGPGPYIGRATSNELAGPWKRTEEPVLTRGYRSEWDGGFIIPSSILKKQDGTFMLWYTAGADFTDPLISYLGLATSKDGVNWIKYNDSKTSLHPFTDSDPVITYSEHGQENNFKAWSTSVYSTRQGFEMYYVYPVIREGIERNEIGFATSPDGIHWMEYPGNPVFILKDDPYTANNPKAGLFEFPSLVFSDSLCFMYYDYGMVINSIGVATAVTRN